MRAARDMTVAAAAARLDMLCARCGSFGRLAIFYRNCTRTVLLFKPANDAREGFLRVSNAFVDRWFGLAAGALHGLIRERQQGLGGESL